MDKLKKAEWILRVAVAGEFIGHGVFALQGKEGWFKYFEPFGVTSPDTITASLLLVGVLDIALAIWVLARPWKPALLWMTFWGFWTALLRPIAGEPFWDFIERWTNWGAPLALWYLIRK